MGFDCPMPASCKVDATVAACHTTDLRRTPTRVLTRGADVVPGCPDTRWENSIPSPGPFDDAELVCALLSDGRKGIEHKGMEED